MMCMELLKPFIILVSQPHNSITKRIRGTYHFMEPTEMTEHTKFDLFFYTVCFHCCFSFSKTKLRCFLGVLPTGAWCCENFWTSVASEDFGSTVTF